MKRLMFGFCAMAVLGLGLVACSDDDDDKGKDNVQPPATCTVSDAAKTAACADKCGEQVSVKDSCDKDVEITCAACEEPTCTVSDEAKAAACAGKCGTLATKDSCDADVSVDCGTDCGDGKLCNEKTQACAANVEDECFFNSECAEDEICDAAHCVDNYCYCAVGTRGTKACGETIEVDSNECASGMGTGENPSICSCECSEESPCPSSSMTCYFGMCLM